MRQRNPADVVLRTRYRQTVLFPDLTERLSLRLSSIVTYTARAHFALWHRKTGGPDFTNPAGVFTPLVVVELEAADVPVEPWQPLLVRGETYVAELLDVEALAPAGRRPDFVEQGDRVWHYGQTDANRHVNGMEYLRSMEVFVADALHSAGHDLRRFFFSRARIVYRKPCFRG